MKVTLAITTMDRPIALYGLLSTVVAQTVLPDEILIINQGRLEILSDPMIAGILDYLSSVTAVSLKRIENTDNCGEIKMRRYENAAYDYVWSMDDDLLLMDFNCLEELKAVWSEVESTWDHKKKFFHVAPKGVYPNSDIDFQENETEFRKFFFPEDYLTAGTVAKSKVINDIALLSDRRFLIGYEDRFKTMPVYETLFLQEIPNFGATFITPKVRYMHVPRMQKREMYGFIREMFPSFMKSKYLYTKGGKNA